jgi:ectoine hydroxylase-related dioxygenase (phytanoyl-CoA dioxygenase family)
MSAHTPEFIPLSEAEKAEFHAQGFVVLRDALGAEEVARIIAAADELTAQDDLFRQQYDAWEGIPSCVSRSPAFHPLLTNARALSAVVQLLGPHVHLLASQYISSKPLGPEEAARWRPRWHRDLYGTSRDLGPENLPLMAIKCGFVLTPHLEPDTGMTLFAPGSHLDRKPPIVPEGATHPARVIEPRVRPGDVILFENRVAHSNGRNLSDRVRKIVMVNFGYRWLMPFDHASYGEELRAQLSPLGRALLAVPRFPFAEKEPAQFVIDWSGIRGRPGANPRTT